MKIQYDVLLDVASNKAINRLLCGVRITLSSIYTILGFHKNVLACFIILFLRESSISIRISRSHYTEVDVSALYLGLLNSFWSSATRFK